MKASGCAKWAEIPGIRGTWCWIEEGKNTMGAVATFLCRNALDEFVNSGKLTALVESYSFYNKDQSQLSVEVHENLQGGEAAHQSDPSGYFPLSKGKGRI